MEVESERQSANEKINMLTRIYYIDKMTLATHNFVCVCMFELRMLNSKPIAQ